MTRFIPLGIVKPGNDIEEFYWSLGFHRARVGAPIDQVLLRVRIEQYNLLLTQMAALVCR